MRLLLDLGLTGGLPPEVCSYTDGNKIVAFEFNASLHTNPLFYENKEKYATAKESVESTYTM